MKVKICTLHPHGHTVSKETAETVKVLLESEIPCFHQDYGCSGDVAKTRNSFVDLAQDWTHLLMIDSDVSNWTVVTDVKRMLSTELDIIGGLCAIHDDNGSETMFSNAWFAATRQMPRMRVPLGISGILDVESIGAAFMMVSRNAMEIMRKKDPQPDINWQWFRGWFHSPGDSKALGCSEDIGFCKNAIACGLTIHADGDARITHAHKPLPQVVQNEIEVLLQVKDYLQREIDTLTGKKVEIFNGSIA